MLRCFGISFICLFPFFFFIHNKKRHPSCEGWRTHPMKPPDKGFMAEYLKLIEGYQDSRQVCQMRAESVADILNLYTFYLVSSRFPWALPASFLCSC